MVDATPSNFAAWGIGKWLFVAGVIELGSMPRLLIGDLTTIPTEPSAYTTQNNGAGPIISDAAQNLFVGAGRDFGASFRFGGDVATIHIVGANLTNAQIIKQWMRPQIIASTVLFTHYGFNGTGTQPDWSGNNNSGAVTGATVADHVPLGPPFGFDSEVPTQVAVAAANPKGPLGHPLHGALAGPI